MLIFKTPYYGAHSGAFPKGVASALKVVSGTLEKHKIIINSHKHIILV